MSDYHVLWKGERYGPYSPEQLEDLLHQGQVGAMHAIYQGETLINAEDFLAAANQKREQAAAASAQQKATALLRHEIQKREQENIRLKRELEQPRTEQPKPAAQPAPQAAVTPGGIAVAREGSSHGQFSLQEIQTGLFGGRFHESDTAWNAALSAWVPIRQVAGGIHPKPQQPPSTTFASAKDAENKPHKMKTSKLEYLQTMRANSSYPLFRRIVRTLVILALVLSAIVCFTSIVGGIVMMAQKENIQGLTLLLGGILYGAILTVFTIFWRDVFTMLADIADCAINRGHRQDQE